MLAEIKGLRIAFPTPSGPVEAVRGVSLTLGQEKLGIVGESGSGKSLTARSLLRLLPGHARITAERLAFDGIDVLRASERQMRQIRGKRAGLILLSHDLPLVGHFCDRIAVMYAGHVVEQLGAGELHQAQHPYTRGLLGCMPALSHPVERLPVMVRDPNWLDDTASAGPG